MSLVTELRRRQVFRAAAWYAAAAWVAIQVASTIVPQFGLPDWSVRAVIIAAAAAARDPTSGSSDAEGAVALELLGEHAAAIDAIDEAVRRVPESQDAAAGPSVAMLRAWILIHSGSRAEEGYRELERLLGAFGVIPRFVSVDPLWRLLENDARVQRTVQAALPN